MRIIPIYVIQTAVDTPDINYISPTPNVDTFFIDTLFLIRSTSPNKLALCCTLRIIIIIIIIMSTCVFYREKYHRIAHTVNHNDDETSQNDFSGTIWTS